MPRQMVNAFKTTGNYFTLYLKKNYLLIAVPLTRKSHKNVDDLLRKLQKGTQRGRNCDNPINSLTESTNTRLDDAANGK